MAEEKKNVIPEEEPLNEKEDKKDEFNNKSLFEKLRFIKSNISVEPILAGLIIPSILCRLAIQNLNLDKACRVKLNFGEEICDSLIQRKGNLTHLEGDVQRVISNIESWRSIIQTAVPTIIILFLGAWSDRTGKRKLCIILPICGEFLVCVSNIVSTFFFYEISVEMTMFLEAFFPAITGGWVTIFLGVFSYISLITDEQSRTFRLGLVNLCMTAGIPIGSALSGILLKLLGYYGVFTLSGLIYLSTICYGCFGLPETKKPDSEANSKDTRVKLSDITSLIKETGAIAFKKRPNNARMKLIMTLLVVAIIYGPNNGERIITYMFLRYRLKWDALKYSFYSTYNVILHSLGALFSISVFSKRWGWHDSVLCFISVFSKFTGSFVIAAVQTDLHMFLVPIVEILNATTFTSLRSMASKLVANEEMGKMNSLFSLVETLAALIFEPTYSIMYSRTLHIFSGTVFIFSAITTVPAMVSLIWLFVQHRKETKAKRMENLTQKETNETDKAKVNV